MPSITQDVIDRHLRPKLQNLLSQCTTEQQSFFSRIYPGGVEKLSPDKIPMAIKQCENTIRGNEAKTK